MNGSRKQQPLLSKDVSNAKLLKSALLHGDEWETLILYMAPAEVAFGEMEDWEKQFLAELGVQYNLCTASTMQCRKDCLYHQGRARMFKEVNAARIRKAKMFLLDTFNFLAQLHAEINKAKRLAAKKGKRLAIRLNGTTDIHWQSVVVAHPDVQFYDYTKTSRGMSFARGLLPSNYHVTFSRSDSNSAIAARVLRAGGNVAVVVDKGVVVDWSDSRLIDGDLHDARFLDGRSPDGRVVVLRAKGSLKGQGSEQGFCLNQAGWDKFLASASSTAATAA